MSHPLVAAVWEQLGRPDIANILREIIGEHAAQLAVSQVQNGLVANIGSLVRMVFWIKAVFDLQRSYIQGLTNVHDCHPSLLPYLLPPETIYSTLMYLIRVKSELLPMTTATVQDRGQYRYYLAETLLAGVRLLLLRGDGLNAEMRSNLARAMKMAWQHPGLSSTEGYLVNVALPSAIGEIGSVDGLKAHPLPSFANGLYPFPAMPETLITDLLTGLVRKGSDHMSSFWRLFDTTWAAESALIQCHVDSRRSAHDKGDSGETAANVEEAYSQSGEARKRLARTVLAASDGQSDTPSLQVLATILLSQNADGHPPLQTRKVRDAWNQMAGFRNALDDSLSHFVRWLINRRVQLWACNGELEAVSHEYQQHLTQWLHGSSPIMDSKRHEEIKRRSGAMYSLGSPSVHPVPKALFEEHLRKEEDNLDEWQLQVNPQLLSIDTSCLFGPEDTKIHHARVIEPLEQLPDPLKTGSESESITSRQSAMGSLSARTGSLSSSFSHSTRCSATQIGQGEASKPSPPIGVPKMKCSQSLNTMASSLNHLSPPWPDKHQKKQPARSLSRELKSVKLPIRASSFRKTVSKEHRLPRQPQFCFSSSGKSLFFWGENNNCVVRFDLLAADGKNPHAYRYDVSGVQCVAAGERCCAIIAAVGQHYELLIFGSTSLSAEAHLTIDTPNLSLPVIGMTVSRDDRRLAFIVNDETHAYELGNVYESRSRSIRKVAVANDLYMPPISPKRIPDDARHGTIIQRKAEFSMDSKRLVVATLFKDRFARVDVWDCDVEPWRIAANRTYSVQALSGTTDDARLTSVFYHSLDNSVFLTASSSEHPILLSTSNSQTADRPFNTGIVGAAQSPCGSLYAVSTQTNEIHLWRHYADSPSTPTTPTRIKRAASKIPSSAFSKPGKLLLSLSQKTVLQVFWMKDERLMLRTIRLFENGEMTSDYDLHGDFDRVMSERESTTNASAQSPRLSPLSGPPVADVAFDEGMRMMSMNINGARSPGTTRPDLPELGAD